MPSWWCHVPWALAVNHDGKRSGFVDFAADCKEATDRRRRRSIERRRRERERDAGPRIDGGQRRPPAPPCVIDTTVDESSTAEGGSWIRLKGKKISSSATREMVSVSIALIGW